MVHCCANRQDTPTAAYPNRHAARIPHHPGACGPSGILTRPQLTTTDLTRTSLPVVAAVYVLRQLRRLARGLPKALPSAITRRLHAAQYIPPAPPAATPQTADPSPRPDVGTLNVQMSLRAKLRALDAMIREYQFPVSLHLEETSPHIVVHVVARTAGGCTTMLFRARDMTISGHHAPPPLAMPSSPTSW